MSEMGDGERRFLGPDCGVDGCEREVGHVGDHARPMGQVRVGRNADGSLDEVVVAYGISDFHIEQMGSGHWWFAVYMADGSRHNFQLYSRRRIEVTYEHEPWIGGARCAINGCGNVSAGAVRWPDEFTLVELCRLHRRPLLADQSLLAAR